MQPRGLYGGHHRGIPSPDHGGLSPIITPLNPVVVLTVSYEYLSCLPTSEQLRPPARRKARGLHSGHHRRILSPDHGGLNPIITPLNPAAVPTVSYEYLFCLPSSEWLWLPARRKDWGLLSGSCTPGTAGCQLRLKKYRYGRFPPAANDWGTIHPVLDMVPPLLTREEGSPT
jgi:hypothetical protein